MPGLRQIDPLARQTLLAVAAGRTAIGVGALLATRPALRLLGFPEAGAEAQALARLTGGRDIALGLLTIAARRNRAALRTVALAAAAVDATDAVSLGLAAKQPGLLRGGLGGGLSGAAGAAAGIWSWRRLGGA